MSTGKRLAKRSILGTKVMVPGVDDRYHLGLIQAIKTSEDPGSLRSTENRYAVRFEDSMRTFEFLERDLVGPGFKNVSEVQLNEGQKVFVTYNNREMPGRVVRHDYESQEVLITVSSNETEETILVKIEDVRLLESRKSARLVNSDTDFSKLADLTISTSSNHHHLNQVEKRKGGLGGTKAIEVPRSDYVQIAGSRKRRTSENVQDDEEVLSECSAALLLMKLSCSPSGNLLSTFGSSLPQTSYMDLPSPDGSSSGASSFRSPTPSPPLSTSNTDEGIVKDLSSNRKLILYQCTFPGCHQQHSTQSGMETHVRKEHLNRPEPKEDDEERDHEEEFYYTEIEIDSFSHMNNNIAAADLLSIANPSFGLVDHMDMARPAHEDPTVHKKPYILIPSKGKKASRYDNSSLSKSLPNNGSFLPVTIAPSQVGTPGKLIFISPPSRSQHSSGSSVNSNNGSGSSNVKSPNRRPRDGKKCRKVYGLEQRDLWCTQCKWKKACARFGAQATEPLALNASSVKSIKF